MSPTSQIDVSPLRPWRASLSPSRLQCAITRFRQDKAVGLLGGNECESVPLPD